MAGLWLALLTFPKLLLLAPGLEGALLPPGVGTLRYGIVIDAGSSGSRVNLYQWPVGDRGEEAGATLPHIQRAGAGGGEFKVKPGISAFQDKVDELPAYMSKLVDFAKGALPPAAWPRTPIFLLATAGMRMVEKERAQAILRVLCQELRASPFPMPGGCGQHVQVITGEWEGIYGWLAANYMKRALHQAGGEEGQEPTPNTPVAGEEVGGRPTSYGFMDMGGASTQIAFEPTEAMREAHHDDLTPVTLAYRNGEVVRYELSVTTWLEFGTNEARRRHREALVQQARPAAGPAPTDDSKRRFIPDPCMPKGLEEEEGEPGSGAELTYLYQGTGNYTACRASLVPLLHKEKPCPDSPCYFDGVHLPLANFHNHRFLGVSEYWYSYHSVFGLEGTYRYQTFLDKSTDMCTAPWSQVMERYRQGLYGKDSMERLQQQCFKGAWLMAVMHHGFGIPEADAPFEPVDEIEGEPISWTLGAMLLHVASPTSPWARSGAAAASPVLQILGLLVLALGLLGMAVLLVLAGPCHWRRRRPGSGEYTEVHDLLPLPASVSPKKRYDKVN